jgi:hypothetical protein
MLNVSSYSEIYAETEMYSKNSKDLRCKMQFLL